VNKSFDLIIVGAGIIGAACAAACARGGLKVLVIERGHLGGGATAAGMGHLVVMDDSEAQFALTHYSRTLWHELRPQLPDDVEFDACGTLWVAADEAEMVEVRRKEKFYSARGVRVEVLDAKGVAGAEPNLRPGLAGGLRVTDDAVLYPPCAARFFLEQAQRHGAEFRGGVAVQSLLPEGGVQLQDGSRLSAGRRRRFARAFARPAGPPTQGPPGDHRSAPRLYPAPDCGIGLFEERAFQPQGFRRVQRPAAQNGPGAHRLVPPV